MNIEIDLDYAKNYLKVDFDDKQEDLFIQSLIFASKSFVETYLNRKLEDFNEDGSYPGELDLARLNLMSMWYDTRTIMTPRSNVKEMEYVFSGLLDPHRYWQFGFIGGISLGAGGDLDNIFYDKEIGRFYRAEIVDTYTALTGDTDLSNAPDTTFFAPKDSVDYNQRGDE